MRGTFPNFFVRIPRDWELTKVCRNDGKYKIKGRLEMFGKGNTLLGSPGAHLLGKVPGSRGCANTSC